jgi:hypothetical protein
VALLLVLAFVGHDVAMALPTPSVVAVELPVAGSPEISELHAATPHPHGCQVVQEMVLKADGPELPRPLAIAFGGYPVLPRLRGPLLRDAREARPPTAERSVLQVFRI